MQLSLGRVGATGEIIVPRIVGMHVAGGEGGAFSFEASDVPCPASGLHGYTVRVLPHHADLETSFIPGLVTWASSPSGKEPLG